MAISELIDQTLDRIIPLDEEAMAAARSRQDMLTKPQGSLGRLEELSVILAGIFGQPIPRILRKAVIATPAFQLMPNCLLKPPYSTLGLRCSGATLTSARKPLRRSSARISTAKLTPPSLR